MLDLEPIEAREQKATPGEWYGTFPDDHGFKILSKENSWNPICYVPDRENAQFIVSAHNFYVPALIAEVKQLREKETPKAALKKPIFEGERAAKLSQINLKNYETLKCPVCNHIVADRSIKGLQCKKFCDNCGQALKWEG